ncbi:pyridoxamine 5'-phosphate oxidase family protein [Streptomyces harbinensis]|uniref:pyridoxamine 5'-phosphate oxidase family protein n=1 Tax=Streptomyces harbinensis TaxID=1176198 RepID=UPI003723E1DA
MSQESDSGQPSFTATVINKRGDLTCSADARKPILKAGFVCSVAYSEVVTPGDTSSVIPRCVPMVYGYHEEAGEPVIYLHGSTYWPPDTKRLPSLRRLWTETGVPVCVTVTSVNGLVVGRAAISTSLNYSSVVVNGIAKKVRPEDRMKAFEALTEQIIPGRWGEIHPLTDSELNTDGKGSPDVGVLAISLAAPTEVCAKTHRICNPEHEQDSWGLDAYWAGVVPLLHTYGTPQPDARSANLHTPVPESVLALIARHRQQ